MSELRSKGEVKSKQSSIASFLTEGGRRGKCEGNLGHPAKEGNPGHRAKEGNPGHPAKEGNPGNHAKKGNPGQSAKDGNPGKSTVYLCPICDKPVTGLRNLNTHIDKCCLEDLGR